MNIRILAHLTNTKVKPTSVLDCGKHVSILSSESSTIKCQTPQYITTIDISKTVFAMYLTHAIIVYTTQ